MLLTLRLLLLFRVCGVYDRLGSLREGTPIRFALLCPHRRLRKQANLQKHPSLRQKTHTPRILRTPHTFPTTSSLSLFFSLFVLHLINAIRSVHANMDCGAHASRFHKHALYTHYLCVMIGWLARLLCVTQAYTCDSVTTQLAFEKPKEML